MKYHHTLLSILAFTALLLTSSCTKDDDIEANSFNASIDGNNISFDQLTAEYQDNINFDLLLVTATAQTSSSIEQVRVVFAVPNEEVIEEVTYEQTGSCGNVNTGAPVCVVIGYSNLTNGVQLDYQTEDSNFPGEALVTVESVDYKVGGNISARFSATIFNTAGNRVEIVNGEFNLPIE